MNSAYQSIFRSELFAGYTVVVTGAGSGIGRCTAHEFRSLGAELALVGRNPEKLQSVRDELSAAPGAAGARVSVHVCDIRDEARVEATIAAILAEHHRIDSLINNAGGQFPAALATITGNGWDAVVRTNLTGGFLMARECYRQYMAAHAAGANLSIVNMVADMWHGMPGMGHSGAARAGMLNFTETAALEWAPVRVNAVAPGWIASSGMDTYQEPMRSRIRSLHESVPLRRLGTEAEVAAAMVFLASPAASFISGACLRIDGAAPNAKRVWPNVGSGASNAHFDGFPLARRPGVLDGDRRS